MTTSPDHVTTQECLACRATVPAALYCGCCGAALGSDPGFWRRLLRSDAFAAAPRERITLPLVTSSLFPHLDQRSRNPFRIGMLLLLLSLVLFSVLRWLGPLVTVAGLGVPLLFVLYLWQSDVLRDMPGHVLLMATVLGAGLGVGWVVVTGGLVARSYGIPMAAGFVLQHLIGVGLAISVGGALLMVLPAVVVRLLRPPMISESLDGFVIGGLGALSFTAAATLTRLAPQFTAGLIDNIRPSRLMLEAGLYGIAMPLTAAAAGGLIGLMLWFRPGQRADLYPQRVHRALLIFTGVVVVLYTAIWVVDAARLPKLPQLLLHLGLTVLAVLAARIGMQLALLHEAPDPLTGGPILCEHCERVVPDMPFCPSCGVASRASSRTSRRLRREAAPATLTDPVGEAYDQEVASGPDASS